MNRRHLIACSIMSLASLANILLANPLEITTPSLPSGVEMVPYTAALEATNGVPPYAWSVESAGYTENAEANAFVASGVAQGWHSDDNCWSVSIPFDFPFFGKNRRTLYVSSNGTITFDGFFAQYWADVDTFRQREMISALWADLSTYEPDDIRVEVGADHAIIYWDGHYLGGDKINVTATLTSDGTIKLRYGSGNANGGMIGISAGDDENYLLSDKSRSGSMDNANDIVFTLSGALPAAGLTCAANGIVSGTPKQAGTNIVTFIVQDSLGATTNRTLEILIAPNPNTRPVIASNGPPAGAFSMGEATSQFFRVWAYDPEGSNLTYSWTWDGVSVGGSDSSYTHTTSWGDAGVHTLRCYASDDLWRNIVYAQWTVTVLDDNDGDGMPNWQEIDLGRDPNDPNDTGVPASLSGTIRGEGVALPGAYVELRGLSGVIYYQTFTDESGVYTLTDILPGNYRVKAGAEHFADEWYDNATCRTGAIPYSIPAGSLIEGFDFEIEAGQNPALVEVTSDPSGAAIYLDYQLTTNVTPAVLDVGEVGVWDVAGSRMAPHVITVRKEGRPRPVPQMAPAREAETVGLHFDLTSDAAGSISVVTAPEGATVYVDYADPSDGVTPLTIGNLAPGSHVVLLNKPGYLQPRPILVGVEEGITNAISIALTDTTASSRIMVNVRSVPPGATIYVDYLPTTNVTDAVIDWMDPASHTGGNASHTRWIGASHTLMLRKNGSLPLSPRIVPEQANETRMIMHLSTDVVTAVDADNDGMPDPWEDAYRLWELAPTQHGANDDPDGDGATNAQEMRAGTNPLDKNSSLAVTDADVFKSDQTRMVTFTFETVPGRTYIVQYTDDLKGEWNNLSGLIRASGDNATFTAEIPEGTLHQFYRLIVLTP